MVTHTSEDELPVVFQVNVKFLQDLPSAMQLLTNCFKGVAQVKSVGLVGTSASCLQAVVHLQAPLEEEDVADTFAALAASCLLPMVEL